MHEQWLGHWYRPKHHHVFDLLGVIGITGRAPALEVTVAFERHGDDATERR